MDLPIMVANNQQRDVTSFSNYLPGAQPGAQSSLFSGTASRVEEVYLDGIPLTTISQIGDNRPIFNLVPFEGIGEVDPLIFAEDAIGKQEALGADFQAVIWEVVNVNVLTHKPLRKENFAPGRSACGHKTKSTGFRRSAARGGTRYRSVFPRRTI
jgi:hypothetical protein